MGHNSVVLGHPKSTGIPRVDGLSMGPLGFGASQLYSRRGLLGVCSYSHRLNMRRVTS